MQKRCNKNQLCPIMILTCCRCCFLHHLRYPRHPAHRRNSSTFRNRWTRVRCTRHDIPRDKSGTLFLRNRCNGKKWDKRRCKFVRFQCSGPGYGSWRRRCNCWDRSTHSPSIARHTWNRRCFSIEYWRSFFSKKRYFLSSTEWSEVTSASRKTARVERTALLQKSILTFCKRLDLEK